MKTLFTRLVLAACSMLTLGNYVQAAVVSFGSGANQFNMEFVTIGNPFNTADTSGDPNPAGSVGYVYGIGRFEVSIGMINKYNENFGIANSLVITPNIDGTNKPIRNASWNEAARFVNWLNTSKGGFAAYKFTTTGVNEDIALWDPVLDPFDYDPLNKFRSKRATYVLPSYNEWYKAAYFDPNKPGGAGYWIYPTGSNTAPTAVPFGTQTGTAVYLGGGGLGDGPADVDSAGGLSPYGVMGMGGNVLEWEESAYNLQNDAGNAWRASRGGHWNDSGAGPLGSGWRISPVPPNSKLRGFRVAMVTPTGGEVPEPTSLTIFGLGALGMAYRARRKAKV